MENRIGWIADARLSDLKWGLEIFKPKMGKRRWNNMIDKEQLEQEERQWKVEKDLIKRKQKIDKEKAELKRKGNRLTTTKLLILFLFINCTIIEMFTGWTVIQSFKLAMATNLAPDFTPLVTLIGAVVGEVLGFAVYALKSAKENTSNGITYMAAKYELENNNDGEAG